jgi:hypothetical protein
MTAVSEKLPGGRGDQSRPLFLSKTSAMQEGLWQRKE